MKTTDKFKFGSEKFDKLLNKPHAIFLYIPVRDFHVEMSLDDEYVEEKSHGFRHILSWP